MHYFEHRFEKRYETNFIAYIMWDGRLIEGTAINISPQGITLKTRALSCPANLKVSVCCFMSDKDFDVSSAITHNTNDTIGIEFNQPQTDLYQSAIEQEQQKLTFSAA
ncbi:PilZ domain-containing protein [Pseudomonadota bacterium]